jgi:hypothetical protein
VWANGRPLLGNNRQGGWPQNEENHSESRISHDVQGSVSFAARGKNDM